MNRTYLGCPPVSHADIASIVSRCHVGESMLTVVRLALAKMDWTKVSKRPLRRYVIAAAIQSHRENRAVYRQVMGRHGGEFIPSYFWDAGSSSVLIAPPVLPERSHI